MRHRGFTLIELLVVIAIIGVLSSIVLVSVNQVRIKSRDARRIADMRTIQTALEFYYDDNGRYPTIDEGIIIVPPGGASDASQAPPAGGGFVTCDTWDCSNQLAQGDAACGADPNPCPGEQFLVALVPKYLGQVPVDPLNTGNFYYRYARFLSATGSGGCLAGSGNRYILQIRRFEGGINTYRSPGFCYPASGTAHWSGGSVE